MIELISLTSIAVTFFIVTVYPGPATISNATVAMQYGRITSLVYGAGLSCGLAFWGLVAASGMGAVLQSSLYLLIVLKVLGGLYLLWLAFQSARLALLPSVGTTAISSKNNWFFQGLLLNLSNPKAVLAWMAALSVGLNSSDGIYAIATATLVCIILGFAANAFYSILFSFGRVMRAYQSSRRWVDGVVPGLFALAGFSLIRSSLQDGAAAS
jgi:threonine efflux protein